MRGGSVNCNAEVGGKVKFRAPWFTLVGENHFPKAWKRRKSLEAYRMGFKNNRLQALYNCEIPESG